MFISRFLADINLTPDERHVLEIGFNHALREIGLVDRNDPVCVDFNLKGSTLASQPSGGSPARACPARRLGGPDTPGLLSEGEGNVGPESTHE
ncbi:hypothetical protein SAMN05216525_13375 [Bradyrhizobium sp. Gha]|nr:hypothetical protein SAMN05216525_13375 [Bradyrhizobium sp. Gha]